MFTFSRILRVKHLLPLVCITSLMGCSTLSQKRNSLMAQGFLGGYVVGTSTAPAGENKGQHGLYWGALAAAGMAVIGNSLYNDEDQRAALELENAKLKADLEMIQNSKKILVDQGKGNFKERSGELSLGGKRAHWKLYQVDRWVKDGPYRLIHQDQVIEIEPPQTSP